MKIFLFVVLLFFDSFFCYCQKTIGDCTITYNIYVAEGDNFKNNEHSTGTKTLYIKGKQTRADINSASYFQSIIYDNITGTAVILKEVGANKYISTYDSVAWKKQNDRYTGMQVTLSGDTKTILGYATKKAGIRLKDGTTFFVYYTTAVLATAVENPYQFKNIPGLILEYETAGDNENKKIIYRAAKIDLSPVPVLKFEIPKKGYRVL